MSLIYPWDSRYQNFTPQEKFQATTEAAWEEAQRDRPDTDLYMDLLDEREARRLDIVLIDPIWDLEHNMYVSDLLTQKTILFKRSPAQLMMHDAITEDQKAGKPVRHIYCKSRRVWGSELVAKVGYQYLTRGENRNGLMLAHDDPSTIDIFRKFLFTHKHDPLAPKTERSSKNELLFSTAPTGEPINSQITCRTAGSTRAADIGRGSGLHFIQFDECALYPGDPRPMMTSLMATVPPPPVQTMVFMVSTARGVQGMFYDEVMSAWKGDSKEWRLVFIPWHARMDARREFDKISCDCTSIQFELSLDEREAILQSEYGLTLEQLHWYRHQLLEGVRGHSMDERLRLLKQEFPSHLMEAFQSSSDSAFDAEILDKLAPKCRPAGFIGEIKPPKDLWDKLEKKLVELTPRPRLVRTSGGPLSVWEAPKAGVRYAIGVDLAEGRLKGDYTVAVVFRRDSPRKFVALWRAKRGPKQAITPVRLLSKLYNDAWICPEVNFAPTFVEDLKETDRRSCLYWRPNPDRSRTHDTYQHTFGWRTTRSTKRNLVEMLREKMELEPDIFTIKELVDELRIFQEAVTDGGDTVYPGAPASDGSHDDVVIASALALYCDYDMPLRGEGPKKVDHFRQPAPNERWDLVMKGYEESRLESGEGLEEW